MFFFNFNRGVMSTYNKLFEKIFLKCLKLQGRPNVYAHCFSLAHQCAEQCGRTRLEAGKVLFVFLCVHELCGACWCGEVWGRLNGAAHQTQWHCALRKSFCSPQKFENVILILVTRKYFRIYVNWFVSTREIKWYSFYLKLLTKNSIN